MVAKVKTFAFSGVEVVDVDVEVRITPGSLAFMVVGLGDKAVAESKERVRGAIGSIGLSLPCQHITVNLAPADLIKEGSHFDLAIALGLLIEMGVIAQDDIEKYVALGELSLDGSINPVNGILSSAMGALSRGMGLVCPYQCGGEAMWAGELSILASRNLLSLVNHFKGYQTLAQPQANSRKREQFFYPDLRDVKGQELAKRALEIAAAGGHNMLMCGPPGSGKSMLASRLPGILPEPNIEEILDINIVASMAGNLKNGELISRRPYRDPHHSCSMPAMVGGGAKARPGEISLAHNGVLFLDELPEFPRAVLDSLRQPIETGRVTISRAHSHVTFPANFQLIAAMNPCRCGHLMDAGRACRQAPLCAEKYQSQISGPLMDRMDIYVEVPAVDIFSFKEEKPGESSEMVARRVAKARKIQEERYKDCSFELRTNSRADGEILTKCASPDEESLKILKVAVDKMGISMRGYNRILRVARTIADLEGIEKISKNHILEAISYRKSFKSKKNL